MTVDICLQTKQPNRYSKAVL